MKTVITVFFTLTIMLVSQADAQVAKNLGDLTNGGRYKLNLTSSADNYCFIKLDDLSNGSAYVKFWDKQGNAVGYLYGDASNGDQCVLLNPMNKGVKWKLQAKSNGWIFIHPSNSNFAVSADDLRNLKLKITKNSGKSDQLFELEEQ